MSAENKAVVRRLIDEVWNQRAFDVLDDLFAADALVHDSGVTLAHARADVRPGGYRRGLRGISRYSDQHRRPLCLQTTRSCCAGPLMVHIAVSCRASHPPTVQ